jgi:putative colanic acid biosynthesis glycosyltransferase
MDKLNLPLVSIIVAVYNGEASIEKTLQSIFIQDYSRFEVVVIDGKSSDLTVKIIEKYINKINFFISEKDSGIANAYNKGVNNANGDWIYFLNSDDIFCASNTLTNAVKHLDDNTDILSGVVLKEGGGFFNGKFGWKLLLKNQVHHQSNFYRATILKKFPYNEEYARYGHDHEHNILLWKNKISIKYIKLNIALWASGGISDTANWNDYLEEFTIRRNSFGIIGYPFNIFTIIRFMLKRIKNNIRSYS